MNLTDRDIRIVRDVALSHVLSRDQLIRLGYFSSVSRLNRRMAILADLAYIRVIETPFFNQRLYGPSVRSVDVVGPRVAPILRRHHETPRFLQHSLAVTDVRIALTARGFTGWRFEAQLRQTFTWGGKVNEIRPDGQLSRNSTIYFIEADRGHVSATRFERKLRGYSDYAAGGTFSLTYGAELRPTVLTVTTGVLRMQHLRDQAESLSNIDTPFLTFNELAISDLNHWS